MKKITEETLNAIQENVRTRETQELDYRRENLFKGSWKDFKIKDLKPNLIPYGWDIFFPHGSGKNYVENWDFSSDDISQFEENSNTELSIKNDKLIATAKENAVTSMRIRNIPFKGKVMLRIKSKSKTKALIRPYTGTNEESYVIQPSNEYMVHEHVFEYTDIANDLILYIGVENVTNAIKGDSLEIDWIQITPVDDQHLVVEKTPLGNGLTRIQTWGGNNNIKLLKSIGTGHVGKLSLSTYVKPNNTNGRIYFQGVGIGNNIDIEKHLVITGAVDTNVNAQFRAVTHNVNSNLDFIASDPQIVEGDVPNPVMIVTPLDDGREHVQVYGATKDTKLVYSGNEGFIGEDYGLKTTIENNGIDLDFSTSLTEEKKRIEKGENKVNLQGELSTKLSIEIGVPSE